ncbi:hypothetical protein DPV78_012367 [Talaromyces pinophilus]|nr:hypothetical protein DPV78_012367 [Talaromyces pinophilus]
MVGICTENYRTNWIVVSLGILQSFDYQGADAFASAIAIRFIVKCLAIPSSGQEMSTIQTSRDVFQGLCFSIYVF